MPEEVVVVEQPVFTAPAQEVDLPAMTPDMAAAFSNPQASGPVSEQAVPDAQSAPAEQQSTAPEVATPAEVAAPPAATAPDYGDLLKDLGVESVDALKERWNQTKDYDPQAVETLRTQQRDAHDEAVRNMLADPQKARDYFELQALPVDALATGTPEQQRTLLFEQYKLANPEYKGRLAELAFDQEYTAKYGAMDGDDDDPLTEFAKLRFQADLGKAAPAVKAAQEAAKITAVPKPEPANQPSPEQQKQLDDAWLAGVDTVLRNPRLEQVFQTENGPVTVGFDTKDDGLKAFMEKPVDEVVAYLNKLAYPNGQDKAADFAALAQAYLRLTKPESIATAAAAAGKASVGAHVPMERLTNPTPTAPLPPGGQGDDQAGALAAIRAVAQGRR